VVLTVRSSGVQLAWCCVPVTGSHVATVQALLSVTPIGAPGSHVPPAQVSPLVQALPAWHDVPSGAVGFEHVPLDGLHVPATWH
jgi:hypothetical protein